MRAEEIIKKVGLDKTSWTFKGFHGIPFTFYYIESGPFKWCRDYYGDQCKKGMFFASKDYVRWYWPDDDMRRLRKMLIKNVNEDHGYLKKMRKDWLRTLKDFDELLARIEKTDLKKLTDDELFNLYDEFQVKFLKQFGIVMTVQDAFSMYSGEFLEPAFAKVLKQDKFTEHFSRLMHPVEDSFISTEKKSRLNILKEAKKYGFDSDKVKRLLKEHQKKFFWIRITMQNNRF